MQPCLLFLVVPPCFQACYSVPTWFLWALLSLCPLGLVLLERAGLLARLSEQVRHSTLLEGMWWQQEREAHSRLRNGKQAGMFIQGRCIL